jgi:hypothetical protein
MDVISVSTVPNDDGTFAVRYKLCRSGGKAVQRAGMVTVALHSRYSEDRPILAELGALHHLLADDPVLESSRCGNQLAVEVSFGAIRKAVTKGSLKSTDAGRTDKSNVAHFAHFLATRFFEATVSVVPPGKWEPPEEAKIIKDAFIEVSAPSVASLGSCIGQIIPSRHAMNRMVERFVAADQIKAGKSLEDLDDTCWTRAWKIIAKHLPQTSRVKIPHEEHKRILRKYGPNSTILHHQDAQIVYVVVKEPYGLVLATVLKDSDYCRLVPKPPKFVGGRLVRQAA